MGNLVDVFVEKLITKNGLQKKYLTNWKLDQKGREELESVLLFFTEGYGEKSCDMEFLVDSYIFLNNMVSEETYFFMRHGRYRNSTFKEVNDIVYNNKEYMEKYMVGLSISDYIWVNHLRMIRYFEEKIRMFYGNRYLEIGPGFGQYLSRAIEKCDFKEYQACDASEASVRGSNQFLKYKGLEGKCVVEHKNFFAYDSKDKFDCIVMGEVLEHVEKPLEILMKIHDMLSENGKAFITTVINAPAIDHIYLFNSIEEVLDIVEKAGFKVVDYVSCTAGDIPLEKAVKKKAAINIAMILDKH